MNRWNEDKLDAELELLPQTLPDLDVLEGKILRSIREKLTRTVLYTLLAVAALGLAVICIVSPLLNALYFDPYALNNKEQKMLGVMRDYTETTQPYREVIGLSVEKKGFGSYGIEMQVADTTLPLTIGTPNIWCKMRLGKYSEVLDGDFRLRHTINRFTEIQDAEEVYRQIQSLPASATVYVAVSDARPRQVSTLQAAGVTLDWIQVYQPNAKWQGGLALQPKVQFAENDIRESMTEQQLLAVYLEHLQTLQQYKAAWEQFGLCDGSGAYYPAEELEATYEDALQLRELTCKNYCISGKRDDMVQFLRENTWDSLYIEQVVLW